MAGDRFHSKGRLFHHTEWVRNAPQAGEVKIKDQKKLVRSMVVPQRGGEVSRVFPMSTMEGR